MLKSKWIIIPAQLMLVLLAITIYFYFQHPVIYRYTGFNASIPIGEDRLIIDEISINNIDYDKSRGYRMKGDISWPYQLLEKINPPVQWHSSIYRLISFYSRAPLTKEYGTMQIYGNFIFSQPFEDIGSELLSDRYDISIYPAGASSGSGWTQDFFDNALAVSSRSNFPLKAMDKPFLLTVTDKIAGTTTQLLITPSWQKERIIKRESGGSPATVVGKHILGIYQEQNQKSLQGKPSAQNIIMEGSLKWLDVFEKYYGVYQVEVKVTDSAGKGILNPLLPDRITVYMHKDDDGKYQIIYSQSHSDNA